MIPFSYSSIVHDTDSNTLYFVGHLHLSPNSALCLWGCISLDTPPDQRSRCSFWLNHIVPSFWLCASAGSWLPSAMIVMPPTSLWEQPIAVLRKDQGRISGKATKSFLVASRWRVWVTCWFPMISDLSHGYVLKLVCLCPAFPLGQIEVSMSRGAGNRWKGLGILEHATQKDWHGKRSLVWKCICFERRTWTQINQLPSLYKYFDANKPKQRGPFSKLQDEAGIVALLTTLLQLVLTICLFFFGSAG